MTRRAPRAVRARRAIAAVAVLAVGSALALLTAPGISSAATTTAAAAAPTAATPVQHLVVMTQDAHSFDNYFGTRAGVDGIPPSACSPVHTGVATPCVVPFSLVDAGLHPTLRNTAAAQAASETGGTMDGFVVAQTTGRVDGTGAMGFYRPSDLPVTSQLADQGVLFDHWFSAEPGNGIANRVFALTGVTVPEVSQVPAAGWPDLPVVFDRLQAAGVSWKVYVENYEPALSLATAGRTELRGGQVARVPLLAMARYEKDPALMSHVADLDTYYSDLAAGTLPAVSWIVTTASTERPPTDPTVGQRAVRSVVNALEESRDWGSSAFLLTYDSSGGWYDHVAPPVEKGYALGMRVPTILVSPYATAGTVDHTDLDSASVLRFIETNWSLLPLGARDSAAPDLATAFSFQAVPRAAAVVGLVDHTPASAQPRRPIIYATYLFAVLAAALVIFWAALSGRRRAAGDEVTA